MKTFVKSISVLLALILTLSLAACGAGGGGGSAAQPAGTGESTAGQETTAAAEGSENTGTAGNSGSSGTSGNTQITGSTEAFRTIQVDRFQGIVDVTRSDSSKLGAYVGLALYGGDGVLVNTESDMVIAADSDKHLYAEENTRFRLESSGSAKNSKTKILLEDGGVLCRLENKLGPDEAFEVETPSGTMAVRGTVFRVKIIHMADGTEYTLIEVFDGVVEVTIKATGKNVSLESGEAALIKAPGEEEEAEFVLNDEIDKEFWRNGDTEDFVVRTNGVGSPILTIPFEKIPDATLEELIAYIEDGEELCVDKDILENVLETGHNYLETVLVVPTCLKDGRSRYECTLCGHTYEGPTKGAHVPVYSAGRAATCAEAGFQPGTHCSVCRVKLTDEQVIPKTAHTAAADAAVAATCTAEGKTEGSHCSVCGTVITAQQTVAAAGHTMGAEVRTNVQTADVCYHTEQTCSVCGEVVANDVAHATQTTHETPLDQISCYDEVVSCTECGLEISRTPVEHQMNAAILDNGQGALDINTGRPAITYDEAKLPISMNFEMDVAIEYVCSECGSTSVVNDRINVNAVVTSDGTVTLTYGVIEPEFADASAKQAFEDQLRSAARDAFQAYS